MNSYCLVRAGIVVENVEVTSPKTSWLAGPRSFSDLGKNWLAEVGRQRLVCLSGHITYVLRLELIASR